MKKTKSILAFTLILVLMFSLSVSAFAANTKKVNTNNTKADTAEVTELNWKEFEDALKDSELEGDFYELNGVTAKFWVPSFFKQVELTDEDAENGLIAYFDDGSENSDYGFFVTYFDLGGETPEKVAEGILEDEAYYDVEPLKINGLDALGYTEDDEEYGVSFKYVSFATDDGALLTFTYWDFADEDFQAVVAIMAASIQPADAKTK